MWPRAARHTRGGPPAIRSTWEERPPRADARRAPHPRGWLGVLVPRAMCDRDTAVLGSPGLPTGGAPYAHAPETHTRSRDGHRACGERHPSSARGPAAQAWRRGSCRAPRREPRAAAGGPVLDARRPDETRVGWQRDRLPPLLRQQGAPRHPAPPSPAAVLARRGATAAAPRRPASLPRYRRGTAPLGWTPAAGSARVGEREVPRSVGRRIDDLAGGVTHPTRRKRRQEPDDAIWSFIRMPAPLHGHGD